MPATDVRTALQASRKRQNQGSWLNILKQAGSEWVEDSAPTWAAAVACYTLLAMAPLLVVAIKVAGIFVRNSAEQVSQQAQNWIGPSTPATAQAIGEIVGRISQKGGGIIATAISLVIAAISVGGVFAELQQAMNRIWKVKPKPGRALWGFVRARLKSVGVLGVAVILVLASVSVTTWLEALTKEIGVGMKYVLWIIDVLVSVGVLTLLFALLYKTVPDARIEWRTTWIGALLSAVLFQVGKYGLALYFKFGAPSSAFGAVGSLAAILIWIYYSTQIVFFGAEFTQAYAKLRGHGVRPSRFAEPLSECDETETATPSSEKPGQKPPRPVSPRQYGTVLGRYAPQRPRAVHLSPAMLDQIAERQSLVRAYIAAGAGLAVGALLGSYGTRRSQVDKPRARQVAAARLDARIKRVEQKVGHVSRIKRYLEQEDVLERIEGLRKEVRAAGRKLRRSKRNTESWTRRMAEAARHYF